MARTPGTTGKLRRVVNLGLTKPLVLLSAGVLFPVLLSSALGIVALVMGESSLELITGILALCFALTSIASGVIVVVWLGQKAHTARLQSDLLSNVSHELKTPLAGIRMSAQSLLLDGEAADPEVVIECARAIDRESRWLEATVERLLAWRTSPRDREGLRFIFASVNPAMDRCEARFRAMISVETPFFVELNTRSEIHHDPNAVESIVMNLLTNAYKYSPHTSPIRLEAVDFEGGVRISVSDRGPGIERRDFGRVFEPFKRGRAHEHEVQGAGLGLAIVKTLVEAHRGTVQLESTVGEGSRFVVTLPMHSGERE